MLDEAIFAKAWAMLKERFHTEASEDQTRAYFAYLRNRITTEEFREAAATVWATNRFFPRPVDFLIVGASREWGLLLRAANSFNPPSQVDLAPWDALSTRTHDAIRASGGRLAVRDAIQKNPIQFRQRFVEAFEMAATVDSGRTKSLPEVTPDSRRIVGEVMETEPER